MFSTEINLCLTADFLSGIILFKHTSDKAYAGKRIRVLDKIIAKVRFRHPTKYKVKAMYKLTIQLTSKRRDGPSLSS